MLKRLLVRAALLVYLPLLAVLCLLLKGWWAYGDAGLRNNLDVWLRYFLQGSLD